MKRVYKSSQKVAAHCKNLLTQCSRVTFSSADILRAAGYRVVENCNFCCNFWCDFLLLRDVNVQIVTNALMHKYLFVKILKSSTFGIHQRGEIARVNGSLVYTAAFDATEKRPQLPQTRAKMSRLNKALIT